MKILLLLSESWNDIVAGNNNMTNWFQGFEDVEIWTISGSGVHPANNCCKDYFIIGENEMIKSLIGNGQAGCTLHYEEYPSGVNIESKNIITQKNKAKQQFAGETARLVRDLVWRWGKINKKELQEFIDECQPDIIFSQRRGSIKMCRIERLVASMTNAPLVAYTGDDDFSLHQYSLSPIYWIRRFWVHRTLKRTIPIYKLLYSMSVRQMKEFNQYFDVPTKFLVKTGDFDEAMIHTKVNRPIRFVYAGKLYCNRWRTLGTIADCMRNINAKAGEQLMVLDVYTPDEITTEQNRLLNDGVNSVLHKPVPASQLPAIFSASDVLLHVESFDRKYRLATQDSFSTKVMDYMKSGCAVFAVCWEGHSALRYLKEKDAAITASNKNEIQSALDLIAKDENVVKDYARKAYECGVKYHQRKDVQNMIYSDFEKIIKENQ